MENQEREQILYSVVGGMDREITSHDCFLAALRQMLKREKGRVTQKDLASSIGVSYNHLNGILNERVVYQGEDPEGKVMQASGKLQETVADFFNYSYVDFLQLGAGLVNEGANGSTREEFASRDRGNDIDMDPEPEILKALASARQLKSQLAEWKGIIESVADGVIVADDNMNIIYANQAFRNLVGVNPVGKPCKDLPYCAYRLRGEPCVLESAIDHCLTQTKILDYNNTKLIVSAAPVVVHPGEKVKRVVMTIKNVTDLCERGRIELRSQKQSTDHPKPPRPTV